MIFIDSDAYIGALLLSDPHHMNALSLFKILIVKAESLVTSWEVIDEVATKISYTSGKELSKRFIDDRLHSDEKIFFVHKEISTKILDLFNKQTSKNVSLTDCTNMVIAKDLGIDTIFSFDKHYKQNGFKLLVETI
jgi:predicted nucleic acid-binding protein